MPVLLLCILVFIVWLNYESFKTNKSRKKHLDSHWSSENASNNTRRLDISALDYIIIPLDKLPLKDTNDLELLSIQDTIKNLASKRILNLTGITNTELKQMYGVANFKDLSEYDHNYIQLIQTISRWAKYLYDHKERTAARTVLEYGVSCGTDARNQYLLLARIYKELEDYDSIHHLIQTIHSSNVKLTPETLEKLHDIKNS